MGMTEGTCVHAKLLQSCLSLCDLWTVARQAPLFIEFSQQEYWYGLPCLSPGNLSNPEIELSSPAWQADSLPMSHLGTLHPLCYLTLFFE